MVILVDTREQHPLMFPADPLITGIHRETLPLGDYMVEFVDGQRPPITFERKSAADLWTTLTQGYERFRAELLKAQEARLKLLLLLEDSLSTVAKGSPYSRRTGQSILQQCFTLMVRYRLPIVFCQNRGEAALYLLEYSKAIGREYSKKHHDA